MKDLDHYPPSRITHTDPTYTLKLDSDTRQDLLRLLARTNLSLYELVRDTPPDLTTPSRDEATQEKFYEPQ